MIYDSILRPRITVSHLALAKGWASGLDLADLGPRYFPSIGIDGHAMDLRQTKTTLLLVMQELALAAARAGLPGGPALIRSARAIRPESKIGEIALPSSTPTRMTFEAFVDSLADADNFGEAELLAIYEDLHPPASSAEKRAQERQSRLVRRQLDLIGRLQMLVSAPIQLSDSVAGWFTENVASRLIAARINTLDELGNAIAESPDEWFDALPGIGQSKARRIQEFLVGQGLNLQDRIAQAQARKATSALPSPLLALDLSQLSGAATDDGLSTLPAPSPVLSAVQTLDGSVGRFRPVDAPPVIDAANDYEAMKTWLKNKKSPATIRVYEREIMRLIAWSVGVRGRAVTSLMHEDALAFRDFLSAIPAVLQTKKGPPSSKLRGPVKTGTIRVPGFTQTSLSPASITKTLVIISGFFTWLQAMRYTTANPFLGVRAESLGQEIGRGSTDFSDQSSLQALALRNPVSEGRSLPQEVIEAIDDYLDSPPSDKDAAFHARVRFIFYFAYFTGLRISEIAEARRAALGYLQADPTAGTPGGWYINVIGKGDKHRRVSVNDQAIAELERYLAHRDLIALPCPSLDVDPGTFLVGGLITTWKPIASEQSAGDQLALHRPNSKSLKIKAMGDGVRPQTIHLALKRLFSCILASNRFRDSGALAKVQKASAHWLRHTSATHALANGVPIEVVSGNLGHASLDTTSIYIDSELRRNIDETRQGWARIQAAKEARRNRA